MKRDWVMDAFWLPPFLAAQLACITGSNVLRRFQISVRMQHQASGCGDHKTYAEYHPLLGCYTRDMHTASTRGSGHVRQAGVEAHLQPCVESIEPRQSLGSSAYCITGVSYQVPVPGLVSQDRLSASRAMPRTAPQISCEPPCTRRQPMEQMCGCYRCSYSG